MGDPDLDAHELRAAVDRAEARRRELMQKQPEGRISAQVRAMLPKAAELYRRQIAKRLEGDEWEALKVRVFLREAFGGAIQHEPLPGGDLMAHWNENAAALLKAAASSQPLGTFGSGGPLR